MVTLCDVTKSQAGLLTRRFRFLQERGASVGEEFDSFDFQDLLHAEDFLLNPEGK